MAGVGEERQLRIDKSKDVSVRIKEGINFLEICKFSDSHTYACAVYLTKRINMYEILSYTRKNLRECLMDSYERVKTNFAKNKKVVSEAVRVKCPFTLSRMKLPIRGDKCSHIECFDCESYYWLNEK